MKISQKNIITGVVTVAIFAFIALLIIVFSFSGKKEWPAQIIIKEAHAFATPTGARTAAAFFTIKNGLAEDDALISASSDIANITEIHENIIDPTDGTMMMRKIRALAVPAGEKTKLHPKGHHIMFIDLKQPLTESENFSLTLTFEKSGTQEIDVLVTPMGGAKKDPHKGHNHADHDHGHNH